MLVTIFYMHVLYIIDQTMLPYGTSVNDSTLPIALDGSSGLIRLEKQFPFFGTNENDLYVSHCSIYTYVHNTHIEYKVICSG